MEQPSFFFLRYSLQSSESAVGSFESSLISLAAQFRGGVLAAGDVKNQPVGDRGGGRVILIQFAKLDDAHRFYCSSHFNKIFLDSGALQGSLSIFEGAQPHPVFLGTQLVKVSRQLAVVSEAVEELQSALDSVFIRAGESQTIAESSPE